MQIKEYNKIQPRVAKVLVEIVRLSTYVTKGKCPFPDQLAQCRALDIDLDQARRRLSRFRKLGYFIQQDGKEYINPNLCDKPLSARFLLSIYSELVDARTMMTLKELKLKTDLNGFDSAGNLLKNAILAGYIAESKDGTIRLRSLLRNQIPYLKVLSRKRYI